MKNSLHRLLLLAAGMIVTSLPGYAHPGHDGHELTWDLGHLAGHPLATLGCAVVLVVAAWAGWVMVRVQLERRAQSLRASQPNRGR